MHSSLTENPGYCGVLACEVDTAKGESKDQILLLQVGPFGACDQKGRDNHSIAFYLHVTQTSRQANTTK